MTENDEPEFILVNEDSIANEINIIDIENF